MITDYLSACSFFVKQITYCVSYINKYIPVYYIMCLPLESLIFFVGKAYRLNLEISNFIIILCI